MVFYRLEKVSGRDMLKKNNEFLWGDKWNVEDNTAWFVPGNVNVLCCADLDSNYYKIVASFPGYLKGGFRLNSNCVKYDNVIFCIPNYGEYLWCYDLSTGISTKVEIANPNQGRIGILDFWKHNNSLWAVSTGLKQILEIDMNSKKVLSYYEITDQKDEVIARSAKSESCIYITSATKGRIYEFNINIREIKIKDFPLIKNGLQTISANENKVWLSGLKREIYIWGRNNNEIDILKKFPSDFGIYNFDGKEKIFLDRTSTEYDMPAFTESIVAGKYIWFIPFQTNQILYVDSNTNEINVFAIEEEEENEKSIENREMKAKYVLQYVYEDRYIGLYSLKNEVIYESVI